MLVLQTTYYKIILVLIHAVKVTFKLIIFFKKFVKNVIKVA